MADETGVPELNSTNNVGYDMSALQTKIDQANNYYSKVMGEITKLKDKNMAEIMTPGMIMGQGGGDGGMFGGGGLIGGLILGSLLRNNGNLLGGDGAGGARRAAAVRGAGACDCGGRAHGVRGRRRARPPRRAVRCGRATRARASQAPAARSCS